MVPLKSHLYISPLYSVIGYGLSVPRETSFVPGMVKDMDKVGQGQFSPEDGSGGVCHQLTEANIPKVAFGGITLVVWNRPRVGSIYTTGRCQSYVSGIFFFPGEMVVISQ